MFIHPYNSRHEGSTTLHRSCHEHVATQRVDLLVHIWNWHNDCSPQLTSRQAAAERMMACSCCRAHGHFIYCRASFPSPWSGSPKRGRPGDRGFRPWPLFPRGALFPTMLGNMCSWCVPEGAGWIIFLWYQTVADVVKQPRFFPVKKIDLKF